MAYYDGLYVDASGRVRPKTAALFEYERKRRENNAGVAQLVERLPSKQHVAGSTPVTRTNSNLKAVK